MEDPLAAAETAKERERDARIELEAVKLELERAQKEISVLRGKLFIINKITESA